MTKYQETVIPGRRLITIKQGCTKVGISRASLYRLAKAGVFRLVYPLPRSPRLVLSEVEAYVNRTIAEREGRS